MRQLAPGDCWGNPDPDAVPASRDAALTDRPCARADGRHATAPGSDRATTGRLIGHHPQARSIILSASRSMRVVCDTELARLEVLICYKSRRFEHGPDPAVHHDGGCPTNGGGDCKLLLDQQDLHPVTAGRDKHVAQTVDDDRRQTFGGFDVAPHLAQQRSLSELGTRNERAKVRRRPRARRRKADRDLA